MDIIKKIDINYKTKSKDISKILKKNKNYTIVFKDKLEKIELFENNNLVISSSYNFYGIVQPNNLFIWANSIPGVKKNVINNIKKIKKMSYLFENDDNKRVLFYHQLLTNDVILLTEEEHIFWLNKLLIYLDNSLFFLNPLNTKNIGNNKQIITLKKIYKKNV